MTDAYAERLIRGRDGEPERRMISRTNPPPPYTGTRSVFGPIVQGEVGALTPEGIPRYWMQLQPRRRGEHSNPNMLHT